MRKRTWFTAALLAALLLPVTGFPGDFVRREGTHFMLGSQRYYYMGTSCYYLAYFAQDTSMGPADRTWREMADDLLVRCDALGINVIRIWAFNENDDDRSLQTSPGAYREQAWIGYDYVLHRARELGLRLVLCLVNNWDDYGGMNWYVGHSATASTHDEFYTDASCRQWFKNHVSAMVNRTNTFDGVVYRDDPAVFAWQLANEPRCSSDTTGLTVRNWVWEMAAYAQSVDTNHMVCLGEEGWRSTEPWEGTRWLLNNATPDMDYCVIHCWPDHWTWMWGDSEPGLMNNAMQWVQEHLDAARTQLGKPMVLSEYGKSEPIEGAYGRDDYYAQWFDVIRDDAAADGAAGGMHFWMFEADNSGHDDGFSVFYDDTSTVQLVRQQAWNMNALIAPVIAAVTPEQDGVALQWSAVVGSPDYRVDGSSNLLYWTELTTTTATHWTHSTTPGPTRYFYRIVPVY